MLYVLALRNNQSGGSESLHQFAFAVQSYGIDVRMFYPDSCELTMPPKFINYDLKVIDKIYDNAANVLVVPETETSYLYQYNNIQKCIWWLSRDFYSGYDTLEGLERSAQRHYIFKILYPLYFPTIYLKKKLKKGYFKFGDDKNRIFHMYNCVYAMEYLAEKGVNEDNFMYMCGPIRDEYFDAADIQKENLVAYNPKKNYKFSVKVIKQLKSTRPDINIIPIEGMIPAEIVDLLGRAKVYMDFGQFPGPERIPREAVIMKCNIITSRYGSTRNSIDVPIPDEYKIDATNRNIKLIVEYIIKLCDEFEDHIRYYDKYRAQVIEQRDLLVKNAKLFSERYNLI